MELPNITGLQGVSWPKVMRENDDIAMDALRRVAQLSNESIVQLWVHLSGMVGRRCAGSYLSYPQALLVVEASYSLEEKRSASLDRGSPTRGGGLT